MRNRAKCRKCQDIIESFHSIDFVSCRCGTIAIDGGTHKYKVYADDFSDIIRVDDLGNEIYIQVQDSIIKNSEDPPTQSKKDLLGLLEDAIKNMENWPSDALQTYVTHGDILGLLSILSRILRVDCKEDN